MSRAFLVVALALACATPRVASAADRFTYTMRRELHAVDVASGSEMPFASESVGSDSRKTLGVTGRVAIARRKTMVEDGGQIFAFAEVPEALASKPHDLDVLIDGPDGMKVRGSIRFEPSGSRRVARLFVIPELEPGPTLVEVHARGVHVADWQEIVTEEVLVSGNARLHFGYTLEGSTGKGPAVEVVVEARPSGEGQGQPVVVMSRKLAAGTTKWQEQTEEIDNLSGKKVRFVFRSRPAGGDASGGAPGVVWGVPSIEIDEKRRAYPIILLVSLDSLRTSSVGLYSAQSSRSRGGSVPFLYGLLGRSGSATPFLDEFFGRDAAVMTQATTQSVTTLPSHLTMMTGLNPVSHGVVDETRSLGAGVVTLAEALRSRGWHTAAFTEGGALAGELGFRRGFDLYDEGDSTDIDPAHSDALERAKDWLDEYSGAPLFLFVHSYATRPVHGGVDATRDAKARERQLAGYVAQLRSADRHLRELVEATRGRIDQNDALFVVTSGHGDEFFEHGAVGHGTQLYDEVTRVPLLVRGSKIEETGRHAVSVGLVDVAPTILELAGARVPGAMQGRSFAPLLAAGKTVPSGPRFSEARRPVRLTSSGHLKLWKPPAYSVRDGVHKVIWNGGAAFEAYDLAADPGETRNLAVKGSMPDWARRMATSLKSYPAMKNRQFQPGGKADLSDANRARLESLGYAR
jgi:arylsulfatase A-like enzyme